MGYTNTRLPSPTNLRSEIIVYDIFEAGSTLFLAKDFGDGRGYVQVAAFCGSPHEVRDTARQIVNVLNGDRPGAAAIRDTDPVQETANVFDKDSSDIVNQDLDEPRLDGKDWSQQLADQHAQALTVDDDGNPTGKLQG